MFGRCCAQTLRANCEERAWAGFSQTKHPAPVVCCTGQPCNNCLRAHFVPTICAMIKPPCLRLAGTMIRTKSSTFLMTTPTWAGHLTIAPLSNSQHSASATVIQGTTWELARALSHTHTQRHVAMGQKKIPNQGTAGFSPYFHVPGLHFGPTFLTHSHVFFA